MAFRVMLFGGLSLTVVGVSAAVFRTFRAIAVERLVAAAVLLALVFASASWDGIVFLVAVDLVILSTLVAEHLRIERPAE